MYKQNKYIYLYDKIKGKLITLDSYVALKVSSTKEMHEFISSNTYYAHNHLTLLYMHSIFFTFYECGNESSKLINNLRKSDG